MKNGATYFKYGSILVIVILLLWFFKDLRCKGGQGKRTTDTISVRHDTIIHKVDTVFSDKPKPYKVVLHDTLEIDGEPQYIYLPSDHFPSAVQKVLEDYNSTKYYRDTFLVKYGSAVISDTIQKNRISGRGFSLSQSIPEITNTVTLSAPKRTIGYFGLSILGNKNEPLGVIGADFGLKFKNDTYFGVKGMLLKQGNPIYGVQYMHPIRLRK